jgi:agmatine deiminase
MAWPCRTGLWGEGFEAAKTAFAEVAKAISAFEPVTMYALQDQVAEASLQCGSGIRVVPLELDDSWMRDIGPVFVTTLEDDVAGVDWGFNGWGSKHTPFDKDAAAAGAILSQMGVERFEAPMILEGGSIHVDGEGTLITTEQCLLNANRNPGLGRTEIEEVLGAYLGIRKVIWLAEGLVGDETDGHVDNIACFVRPGVVMAVTASDSDDENHQLLADNAARLRGTTDAEGRELEVIELPLPRPVEEDGERLTLSYINFYVANGGLVMPAFETPRDQKAKDIVKAAYPGRSVVQVPATDIVKGGGGIHCITMQYPAGAPSDAAS